MIRSILREVRPRHAPYAPLGFTVAVSELMFGLLAPFRSSARLPKPLEWSTGVSVVIPERGAAEMLRSCLDHLAVTMSHVDESTEVIVVVNGSPMEDYSAVRLAHPGVRWLHSSVPLGFTRAVLRGLAEARYGAVYLLNNDMLLEPDDLSALLGWRGPQVFAMASQIFFQDSARRREETGWTSMSFNDGLPIPRHEVPEGETVRGTVWAGAGSGMFHSGLLRRLLPESLPFDPFYWEDTDLGVRAWRMGYEILFCPKSVVWHKHRATVERFFKTDEVSRIFERNRLLFQLRNPFPRQLLKRTLEHIAQLDRVTLGELGSSRSCMQLWRSRWRSFRAPYRDVDYDSVRTKRYYRQKTRPTLVIVSPFVVIPPAHGGAVRTDRLAAALAEEFNVVLISDELDLYGEPRDDCPGPFVSVHLVRRPPEPPGQESDRVARIHSHSHRALKDELSRIIALHQPVAVLVEHMELAGLIEAKPKRSPVFILDLHDVLLRPDEASQAEEDRFESSLMRRFDGLVVSSREDQALLEHGLSRLVPNGFDVNKTLAYTASRGTRVILFMGPFRAPINWNGIREFLQRAYPHIESAVPAVSITILGGKGAREMADRDSCFSRPSVRVLDYVEDTQTLLRSCAVTINPQSELRGSSLKVIESLAAGRVCVSTRAGARGWIQHDFRGNVVVERVEDFAAPLIRLLLDEAYRMSLEAPEHEKLAACSWQTAGTELKAYVREVLGRREITSSART